ncbi:MAG: hypothetical protein NT085_02440 [candidate division SR1 bacterium]|nr:hypothetical protein [candidate division SR1 bacterium]
MNTNESITNDLIVTESHDILTTDALDINTGNCKKLLLENLAKEYRIKLDDPEGKEKKYDYNDIKTNNKVVTLDESIGRVEAFFMFFKRKRYLKNLLKTEGIEYFEKLWKENLSDKAYTFCKDIYQKYGIIPMADQKILDYFSRVMGTIYNGNDLGNFTIVRDWSSIEKWPGRIKHEGIHKKQGGIKKRIPSLMNLLKKRKELNGLVPWTMDYATDNQISDWETYINQYKDDPIKNVKPYEFKKYKIKNNRFAAIQGHMQSDIDDLKQDIKDSKQKIIDVKNGNITLDNKDENSFTKEERLQNLTYILDAKEENLKAMEKLQDEHYDTDDRHQFITFGEQDGYIYQETPEKRQTNFQSEESFRKHVAIDMFITHYGDKKDNYKKGVEMYNKYRDKIIPIMEEYVKIKDKALLKKKMNALFTEIG